jgi:hypothetical protein
MRSSLDPHHVSARRGKRHFGRGPALGSLQNIGERTTKQIVAKWSCAGGMDDHHRILDRGRGWCLVGLCRRRYRYDSLGPRPVDVWGQPRVSPLWRPPARVGAHAPRGARPPKRRFWRGEP